MKCSSCLFTKPWIWQVTLVLLMLVGAMFAAPAKAYATEASAIRIDQEITTEGQIPEDLDKTFTYIVQPTDTSSQGTPYRFRLKGNESFYLPILFGQEEQEAAIQIQHAGVFKYQVYLDPNDKKDSDWRLDSTEFLISLDVRNTDDGLKVQTVVIEDGKGFKPETITFSHSYKGAPAKDVPQETHLQIFGLRLPATGDASWGFIFVTALVGVAFLILAATTISSRKPKLRDSLDTTFLKKMKRRIRMMFGDTCSGHHFCVTRCNKSMRFQSDYAQFFIDA